MEYVIVSVAAFIVGVGSTIAGSGGGLAMTPLMILLGFPPQTAIANSKASGLGINIGALSKFTKEKDLINWKWAGLFSVLAVIASIIGTQIVFRLDGGMLKKLVVLATMCLVPVFFINRKMGVESKEVSKPRKVIGTILYFLIMIAQSGLGSGIGSMLMFVLMGIMGFDALRANATKRVAELVLMAVGFTIFAISGYMDWILAPCLTIGMLLGGYVGAHLAVKHGSMLVKRALLIVSLAMGITVLFC